MLITVLSSGSETEGSIGNNTVFNATALFIKNYTSDEQFNDFIAIGERCGANFCPGSVSADANPNLVPPPEWKVNIIAGIYLACMVFAFLVIAFGVDKMSR